MDRVASVVTNECLAFKIKRNIYHINIDKKLVRESVGDTIALLLSKISSKFDRVAGNDADRNIITGTVCSQPTYPQVALGVLMRRNKILISELSKYSCAAHTMKFGCFGTQQLSMLHRIMTKSGLGCVIITL